MKTLTGRKVPRLAFLGAGLLAVAASAGCSSISDPHVAVDALLTGLASPDRSMHLETQSEAVLPLVGEAAFETTFDLVGDEFYGTSRMHAMGEVIDARYARISGSTFSAFFGAETLVSESRPVMAPDPLAGITADDLVLAGTDRQENRDVVHLRVTSSSAAQGAIATFGHIGLGEVAAEPSTFDLYVTADGAPVLAVLDVIATAGGELSGTITASVRIRFSRWGELAELPLPFGVDRFPAGTTFVADNRFDEAVRFLDADGRELLVEACSRGTSGDFDGSAVSVEFAADGQGIMSTEPGLEPLRYVLVSAGSSGAGGELPILRQASPEPCTGRGGS